MIKYKFTILGVAQWCPQSCIMSGSSYQAVSAQITKCISDLGDVFYIRENIDSNLSFNASSGERWGWKTHGRVSKKFQILELCANTNIQYIQKIVLDAVQSDPLKRRLHINNKVKLNWFEKFNYNMEKNNGLNN